MAVLVTMVMSTVVVAAMMMSTVVHASSMMMAVVVHAAVMGQTCSLCCSAHEANCEHNN
jgi:hypothetical protein